MTDINKIVEQRIEYFRVRHAMAAAAWLAIQDVLALHEIDEGNYTLRYEGNDNQVRDETCQCGEDYPCETRTAITKRLGGME